MICVKFTAFCDLRAAWRIRLATLCKSVLKFCFCKLASPFGQGLRLYNISEMHLSFFSSAETYEKLSVKKKKKKRKNSKEDYKPEMNGPGLTRSILTASACVTF